MSKFVSVQSVLQNAQPQDLSCKTKGLGGGFPNKRIQDFWAQDTLLAVFCWESFYGFLI